MGDLKALVSDPDFSALPAERQRALAAEIDPDLAQLDAYGQDRILTRLAPDPMAFTEQRHGLPTGLMQALRQLESSGGTNLVSPTGVMGPYQITGGTGRRYGLPDDQWMDEIAQLATAGNILADNLKTAKGDIRTAVNLYADPKDRAWYADRILARLPAAATSPTGAQPGASVVATASPAPSAPMPAPDHSTTTTPTSTPTDRSFVGDVARYAGLPQDQTTLPEGVLKTVGLGTINMPGALLRATTERATGSETAGKVAEVVPIVAGLAALLRAVPYGVAKVAPSLAPRAAARTALPGARLAAEGATARAAESATVPRTVLTKEIMQGTRTLRRRAATAAPEVVGQVERGLRMLQTASPDRAVRILDDLGTLTGGRVPAVNRAMQAAEALARAPQDAKLAATAAAEVRRLTAIAAKPGFTRQLLKGTGKVAAKALPFGIGGAIAAGMSGR